MTSGGKRKPAKAERALGAGRGRRVLMPAVWLLEGGHRERNSASETILVLSGVTTWEAAERFPSCLADRGPVAGLVDRGGLLP
jgi:hypothetical protein